MPLIGTFIISGMKAFYLVISLTLLQCTATQQPFMRIDALLADYEGKNPGASLLIIRNGRVLLQRNYGYASLESRDTVASATNFRLASVSKQFTAASILQLVHAEKLSLDTRLGEVFPGFPRYGDDVTIKHLLSHTSGIPDYEEYVADTAFNPQIKDQGVLDILMTLDSGYFAPGTRYRYSNSGYALLALTVEKYSGIPFAEYLRKYLFDPLDMKTTLAHEDGRTTVPSRAYGYTRVDGKWVQRDQSPTSAVLGDGGIYSNVLDLAKWDQALYTDAVLPAQWIEEAFANNRLTTGETVHYGYGWHLKQNQKGEQVVYHTGSTSGFRNVFYRIPSRRFSIILLTNRDQVPEEGMLELAEQIAAAMD